jgi:preprotein translocase subunit SecA
MFGIVQRIFGSSNDKIVKRLYKRVEKINALESAIVSLSDEALAAKTREFKERLSKGETLDDLLPEAFAVVREAAKRVLGERHYDVQLMGGMVLHRGMIAEMKTGEGKTLVSTLAAYLNALPGKGVHIVTVNDYLAKRDSEWMGRIHRFLGLTVGCIFHELDDTQRREAYAADITYATNNELGFDYLRDNMKFYKEDMVQRGFHYAIVDEMDSILIDEARTPLIISGPTDDTSELYVTANRLVQQLGPEDYEKDEKQHNAHFTEKGMERIEALCTEWQLLKGSALYDIENVSLVHHLNQALKAHVLYHRDKEYIVNDNQVILIDEFTGRMMEGRRFSDGLHQAIEAKENVPIQMENQTLASITFQNFFRLYTKLSGMTGTAMTEAAEFADIYGLDVVALPTNIPIARKDLNDEVYRTEREKFDAILSLVKECKEREQPVLIGTASIQKSEEISDFLKRHHIDHNVLNARHHEKEAQIIEQAGFPGAITIATNMAGRGTDIKLGGNLELMIQKELEEVQSTQDKEKIIEKVKNEHAQAKEKVLKAGGLYVIGTERHESRRIDNQLRGRSGRQGDPGASKFFLSLQDDLMRIFGSERLDGMLKKLGLEEGEAITHPWINKAIERAQTKVEARNFDIRKHLLKYDDVMNAQRKIIYEQRLEIMESEDVTEILTDMRNQTIDDLVVQAMPEKSFVDQWNMQGLADECRTIFGLDLPVQEWAREEGIANEEIRQRIIQAVDEKFKEKFEDFPEDILRGIKKSVLLRVLDQTWKDHLLTMDQLRQGINLRAYGQKDPLNEYKRESFLLFEEMLQKLREQTLTILFNFNFRETIQEEEIIPESQQEMIASREDLSMSTASRKSENSRETIKSRQASAVIDPKDPSTWGRVSRNDLCLCGSGKKYKQCHGRIT